jgi:hypothetical protein
MILTMKFNCISASLAALMVLSVSALAQESKTVVDYHTTVEHLFNLEDGMTLSEVNQTLGSEPHDLLQNTAGGYMMLEYRYLKAHRKVKSSERDTESGRVVGTPHYMEPASVYLMFNNDHLLVSYVTADALGSIEHQYKLEATARRLGAVDAPCTRNCSIAIPGTEVVEAGEAEVEEVVEEKVEATSTGLAGLFGSSRTKVAAVFAQGDRDASEPALVPVAELEKKEVYTVGDPVWLEVDGQRLKGQVTQVMGSRGLRVKYVDSQLGMRTVLRSVSDVYVRD